MTRWPPGFSTPLSVLESELLTGLAKAAGPRAKSTARIPNSTDKAASLVVIPDTEGHMSESMTENPFCYTDINQIVPPSDIRYEREIVQTR